MYSNVTKNLVGQGFQVFGYARVSTKDQALNSSLETQTDKIREYCRLQNWNIVHVYVDVGSGADTEDRPDYRELLTELHKVDAVIAARLDRWGRNTFEVLSLIDHTKNRFTGLLALDVNVNPHDPNGRLVWSMLASVAEFERELILSRTTTGRAAKAAQGGFAYGAPPFGWTVIGGQLEEVAAEQQVIQLIEKYKTLNWSLRDIAAKLSEQGYKTKRGGAWHPSIVAKILGRFKKWPK